MLGSIIEKTRLGGQEVANGMKTVIARIYQSKSIDPSVTDDDMSKTSAMLSKLGIAVKDTTTGAFRPLNDILKDVAKSEQGMTDSQKSALNGQAAGIRQLNIFATAVGTVGKTQTLTNDAINSSGELLAANGKYMDTAAAKAKVFSATMNAMWQGLISSNGIKDVLDALNTMAGGFSTVASNVGLLGVAFGVVIDIIGTKYIMAIGKSAAAIIANGVAMTAEEVLVRNLTVAKIAEAVATGTMTTAEGTNAIALASMSTAHVGLLAGIKQAVLGFLGFDIGIDGTTMALNGLKIAEIGATAGLILIPMAIGAVINAISSANTKKQEYLDTTAQTITSTKTEIDSNQSLIDQYTTIKNNQDGSATAKQKLVDIEEALAKALPETATGYDAQNNKISTNIKLVEQVNDAKKQTMIIDAQVIKNSMGSIDTEIANAKKEQDAIDKINANRKAGSDPHYLTTKVGSTTTSVDNWAQEDSQMKTYNDDIQKTNTNVDKYNTNSQILNKFDSQTIANKSKINPLVDSNSGAIDKNTKTLTYNINGALENSSAIDKNSAAILRNTNGAGANNSTINNNTTSKKGNTDATNANSTAIDTSKAKANDFASAMGNVNGQIQASKTVISSANTILDQHAKSSEWDMDAILKLSGSHKELLTAMGDDGKMTKALTKIKTDESKKVVDELQIQINANIDCINILGSAYEKDAFNKNASEEDKNKSIAAAIQKRITMYEDEANAELDAQSLATSMTVDPKTGAFTYNDKSTDKQKAKQATTAAQLAQEKADLAALTSADSAYKSITLVKQNLGKYLTNAGDSADNGIYGTAQAAADARQAAKDKKVADKQASDDKKAKAAEAKAAKATQHQTDLEAKAAEKVAKDQLRVAQATTNASRKKAQETLSIDLVAQNSIKQKGETASQLAQDKITAIQTQTSNAAAATQAKLESDKAKATQKQADLEQKAADKVANDQLKLAQATTATSKRNAQNKLTADLAAEDALKKNGAIAASIANANITAAQAQAQSVTDATNAQTTSILANQKAASDKLIAGYQAQITAINNKTAAESLATQQLTFQNDIINNQNAINDAQNNKNTRIYENGKWQWQADQSAIATAKTALATNVTAQAKFKETNTDNASIAALNALIKIQQDKQASVSASTSVGTTASSGYAVGTDNATPGEHPINEKGAEIIVGNKVNFEGGEQVITAPNTSALLTGNSPANGNTSATNTAVNKLIANADLSLKNFITTTPTYAQQIDSKLGQSLKQNDELLKTPLATLLSDVDASVDKFVTASPQYAKDMNNNIGKSVKTNDLLVKTPVATLLSDVHDNIQKFVDASPSYGKDTNHNIGNAITTNDVLVTVPMASVISKVKTGLDTFVATTNPTGQAIVTNMGTGIDSKNKDMVTTVTKLTKSII
ncbi:MAG TPA: hypothetical protein VIM42_06615, partial [Clostridium sp.]